MISLSKIRWVLVLVVLCTTAIAAEITEFSPGLLRYVESRWGSAAPAHLHDWHKELRRHLPSQKGAIPGPSETMTDLEDINFYWDNIRYYTDLKHWGVDDYWATPVEMLASEGGDCEDYAIAKYFSLKALGVPAQNLRITYVRALRWNEAHMVLAYYPTPDADPYILDNLTRAVLHASERTDLVPVYSFNDDDLWAPGTITAGGKSSQIRLWRVLLDKMAKERNM